MLTIKNLRYFFPKTSSKWIKNRRLNELFAFYDILSIKLSLNLLKLIRTCLISCITYFQSSMFNLNILRRLFGQKRRPNELMLLFKGAGCVLSNLASQMRENKCKFI